MHLEVFENVKKKKKKVTVEAASLGPRREGQRAMDGWGGLVNVFFFDVATLMLERSRSRRGLSPPLEDVVGVKPGLCFQVRLRSVDR